MSDTPLSLLDRLGRPCNEEAWQRFVELYEPLLARWIKRYAAPVSDIDDLMQEVFAVLLQALPEFRHDLRPGAFRKWLRGILVNRLRILWRAKRPELFGDQAEQIAIDAEVQAQDNRQWDLEHDQFVLQRLLVILEPEFESSTWQAFHLVSVAGKSPAEAAEILGISPNAVRIGKSRVLKRLREEAEGLIDGC